MAFVTTEDGVEIYYKDWGSPEAQPIMFHHGWPLSADDWDAQMLYLPLEKGYRVIASDRRGHGRSSQIGTGHDMDHYASDANAVVEHLDLKQRNPHRPLDRRRPGRTVRRPVRRAAGPRGEGDSRVIGAPADGADRKPTPTAPLFRSSTTSGARSRRTVPNFIRLWRLARSTASTAPAPRCRSRSSQNWWRQGMTGSAQAHYLGIAAFSETDQTEDLKAISVPVLVTQGDDDQVVPYKDASLKQHELLSNSTLKIYEGYPHGMLTIHADVINPDLLAFIQQ